MSDYYNIIDSAEKRAREEGLLQGRLQGREEGLAEGRAEGHAEGRKEGLEEGREEGLEAGIAKGRDETIAKLVAAGFSREQIEAALSNQ